MSTPFPDVSKLKPVKDLKIKYTDHFINNEFVSSAKKFALKNPSNLEVLAEVSEATEKEVNQAVDAARAAFDNSAWRSSNATERCRLLLKLSDLILRDIEILATIECQNNGKPFFDACGDMIFAVTFIRENATWATKLCGRTIPVDGPYMCYTRLEPIGVCGAILPWNFPLPMMCAKVGPALASGCTIVVKPAEQTPLTALYFCQLIKEAGFPPGVLNVVNGFGPECGAPLSLHPKVDKVSFTGSTEVGRLILQASAKSNLKKVTLELGGKSPAIVFADADFDLALEKTHHHLFFNMGQCCIAGSRTFVQEDIYDKFVKRAVELAQARTVGDPFDPKTKNGPQIDQDQYDKILELIEAGKAEGAKLMCGGKKHGGKGLFIENTVFADVKDGMRIAKEEIFGPVQQIIKFKDIEEVIPRANDTNYGLAASVFTNDLNKALTIANAVKAGTVWVNDAIVASSAAPFGGFKESGMGREYSEEGIKQFCEVKTVFVKLPKKLN